MDLVNALSVSALTTAGIAALAFLAKEWISSRLKESVAAEYKESLEVFKQQAAWEERRKQQAIQVAELFSLWLRHNYYPKEDVNAIRYELQKKYWELALWLDEPILLAVHKALDSHANPGNSHKEALMEVRRLILGKVDDISPESLWHFSAVVATGEQRASEA